MRYAHRLIPFLAFALFASGGQSFAFAQANATTVAIAAKDGSSVSGTAMLTDLGGGKTRVQVKVSPGNGNYPAHIHEGACANPNPAPKYALANVQNGLSISEVNASLADLTGASMAINVYKSAQEMATIAACGDIGLARPAGRGAGGSEGSADPNVSTLPSSGDVNVVATALGLLALGGLGLYIRRLGRARRGRARA